MTTEDEVVAKDEEQLQQLDQKISEARQHLKEQTHDDERSFIDEEGSDHSGETDNNIAPG
jgi:hypothetical protein